MNPDRGLFNPDNRGLLHVVLNSDDGGLFDPDNRLHPVPLLQPHHVRSWCLWTVKLHNCRGRVLGKGTPVDDWGSVNQARCNWCWWFMVVHQGVLLLGGVHLCLVVVLLHMVAKIQSHHMGSGCLRHINLEPMSG